MSDQKIADAEQKVMSAVQLYASIAAQAGVMPNRPAIALEIKPIAPFDFSYTKVRLDTGEAIWRWPRDQPAENAIGGIVDIKA